MAIRRLPDSQNPATELKRHGGAVAPWSAPAGHHFAPHRHDRTKHLYVVTGTIRFNALELGHGQGIAIDANTHHEAWVGAAGVACVETFLP